MATDGPARRVLKEGNRKVGFNSTQNGKVNGSLTSEKTPILQVILLLLVSLIVIISVRLDSCHSLVLGSEADCLFLLNYKCF